MYILFSYSCTKRATSENEQESLKFAFKNNNLIGFDRPIVNNDLKIQFISQFRQIQLYFIPITTYCIEIEQQSVSKANLYMYY